jgi:DNA-binding SARP family transcriptional activator/tetratricopeptide (TPR) repeat protein
MAADWVWAVQEGPAFRILGPLEVSGSRGTIQIAPGRQEVVVAILVLQANRTVSISDLVDLIWDEEPPETARVQVQTCVSRIRKAFAQAEIPGVIETRPQGYLLRVDERMTDYGVFTGLVAESRILQAQDRTAEAARLLRSAADLWRGSCLSGIVSPGLSRKTSRVDERRLEVMQAYLRLELDLGRHHDLVSELMGLVQDYPLHERLRGHLMLALFRCGRQAEALAAYRAGRELLGNDLGLDPGEHLQALERAILANDPKLLFVPGEEVARVDEPGRADGGDGRIDTVDVPETPMPSSPRGGVVPQQLVADTADFVDDGKLIQEVTTFLAQRRAARAPMTVVLEGKPGVGKSTAAMYLGHRLREEYFPDGQLYCDLHGAGANPLDPGDALSRFLRAMGIPGQAIPESLDERAQMYRDLLASRQILVVLDDAATEGQLSPLLPGTGRSAVLVTSRARLTGLPGAYRAELDVFALPQALDLLGRVIGADRVAAEPAAAESLVRAVGGLPLAIRIIAARLAGRPHWTIASMAARLADERRLLDELSHHDLTIRASLQLSYDGLAATDRHLLQMLSLAPCSTIPGWVGGALLDDWHPYPSDRLEPLVDMQLLDVVEVDATGAFRYRFHEVIRPFAQERLAADKSAPDKVEALQRVLGGWLSLAEQAHAGVFGGAYNMLYGQAPRWHPPAEYTRQLLAEPLDWLEGELENLCAAVQSAAELGLDELCWDLATTLATLFESRGFFGWWETTHQVALEAVQRAGNSRGIAAVHGSLGSLYINQRRLRDAGVAVTTALSMFEEVGDGHGVALGLRDSALIERFAGNDDRALALYDRARQEFAGSGDVVGEAIVLTQSAHIWMQNGGFDLARSLLSEALLTYRSVRYAGGQARALRRLGQILTHQGEYDEARRTLLEVLTLVRASRDVVGESHVLRDLGGVEARRGRHRESLAHFSQAWRLRERIMDRGGVAAVRLDVAQALMELGQRTDAGAHLGEIAPILQEHGMSSDLLIAAQLERSLTAAGDTNAPPEEPGAVRQRS